jgi:hypothetical protein
VGNVIWHWNGKSRDIKPGHAADIEAGANGPVWGVGVKKALALSKVRSGSKAALRRVSADRQLCIGKQKSNRLAADTVFCVHDQSINDLSRHTAQHAFCARTNIVK